MAFFSRLLLSGNTKVAACPTAQIYLFAPLAAEGPEGICFRGCVFFTCWALHGCDLKDESLANHPTPENFEIGRILQCRIRPISKFSDNPPDQVVLHALRDLDVMELPVSNGPLSRIINQHVTIDIRRLRFHTPL